MSRNVSGRIYQASAYTVEKETSIIDYDRLLETARSVHPKIIVAGASYPRT